MVCVLVSATKVYKSNKEETGHVHITPDTERQEWQMCMPISIMFALFYIWSDWTFFKKKQKKIENAWQASSASSSNKWTPTIERRAATVGSSIEFSHLFSDAFIFFCLFFFLPIRNQTLMPLSLSLYTYISCVYHHHGDYYYHFHYSYDEYPHLRVCVRVYIYLTFAFFFSSRMLLSASYPHTRLSLNPTVVPNAKKSKSEKGIFAEQKKVRCTKIG